MDEICVVLKTIIRRLRSCQAAAYRAVSGEFAEIIDIIQNWREVHIKKYVM
jgi:hypothetical protein